LLGDSIFDNGAYTNGAPDVISHLRALMPAGWRASLRAVDGSTTADLLAQLQELPADVTHLVISVGGNDVLLNSDILELSVSSTAEALDILAHRRAAFASAYARALDAALKLGRSTTVCTIYNGNFEAAQARRSRTVLAVFNDVILRAAFAREISVIDLGLVCTESSDYANPIEPSGSGGRKIAQMIVASMSPENTFVSCSRVHARLPAATLTAGKG
jgi:hypothetical protein